MASGEDTRLGLILVRAGQTEAAEWILDGYRVTRFPERGLTDHEMRHHCAEPGEQTS